MDLPTFQTFDPSETYTLNERGGVVRGSDGAHIPADEANADYRTFIAWKASGKTLAPIPPMPFDPSAVGDECKRRIYAVASQSCQTNMSARQSRMVGDDLVTYNAGLDWVDQMVATCRNLIAAQDVTFADDAHWPTCPDNVVALAARY